MRQYFDAVMQGSDGIDFWCPNSSPKTLFAVQSYELIGKNTSSILGESGMWIIAQVHSSSKAGNPIVKDWQIGVKQQSTGYCIQRFLENE